MERIALPYITLIINLKKGQLYLHRTKLELVRMYL